MTINGIAGPSLVDLFANGYDSSEKAEKEEGVIVKERVGDYLLFYRVSKGSGGSTKKVLVKAMKVDQKEESKGSYGLIGNALKPKDEIEKFQKQVDMRLDLAEDILKRQERYSPKKEQREIERMIEELAV